MDRKHIRLPQWLDNIIFNDFGAIFEPRPSEVVYNPDQPYEFVKVYLGTYFPRSYAEAYCILQTMLENRSYLQALQNLHEINILDFCCGTGGEIIGLIDVLQSKLPNLQRFNIDAFDANPDAIRFLYHLMESINNSNEISVEININPQCLYIDTEQEIQDLVKMTNVQYQFIVSFKALNEFIQHNTFGDKNVYALIASYLCPLLSQDGLFILSDVTTKLNGSSSFYPTVLNEGFNSYIKSNAEFKTIYPYTCYFKEQHCDGCYMQDIIAVSHSKRKQDISKIAYRIITHKQFAETLINQNIKCLCRVDNPSLDKSSPYKYN